MIEVRIPSSKSQVHRLLIAAALGGWKSVIEYTGRSADLCATEQCIEALFKDGTEPAHLYCGESGSTLRFMLAVAGALGKPAVFHMEGRLPERPLAPYDDELRKHGMIIERRQGGSSGDACISCSGRLEAGAYRLPGNVSSQYVTGLLLALPVLDGDSTLEVTGKIESSAYIGMTLEVLKLAGIRYEYDEEAQVYSIPGNQEYKLPPKCRAEGDWSNAAWGLCVGALTEEGVTVTGLNLESSQGDKAVLDVLRDMGAEVEIAEQQVEGEAVTEVAEHQTKSAITVKKGELRGVTIDASEIPDLIPVLAVVAANAEGRTEIINAGRLRLKESDRIKSTAALINSIGGTAKETEDGLIIEGKPELAGGAVESYGDHRIAMAAAVASTITTGEVTIDKPECVKKSYPDFWSDFEKLGRMKNEHI